MNHLVRVGLTKARFRGCRVKTITVQLADPTSIFSKGLLMGCDHEAWLFDGCELTGRLLQTRRDLL
jgi:hypothetical protein